MCRFQGSHGPWDYVFPSTVLKDRRLNVCDDVYFFSPQVKFLANLASIDSLPLEDYLGS